MEDLERAALFAAVSSWFREEYGYVRLPLGAGQVSFYDRLVEDILEDVETGIELDPSLWKPPHLWRTLGWSLASGTVMAFCVMVAAGIWGWGIFLWVVFGGGLLLLFPCMVLYHNRSVVEITEGDDVDVETVRQLALACYDSTMFRWCLHRMIDFLLLACWASCTQGVAVLVAEEYAAKVGSATDRSTLTKRQRRGAMLVARLVELMGDRGLEFVLRRL